MDIYHCHSVTGEFLGTSEADESPLEPGVFLVPAHATEIAPPEAAQGMARVFAAGAWSQVEDRRGGTWWRGDGTAVEPPPPLPVLPTLTPRQLRLMMLNIGMTDAHVEAQIDLIPDAGDKAAALIEWQWATLYERDHPLVLSLAAALEFEPAQLDALWLAAAEL